MATAGTAGPPPARTSIRRGGRASVALGLVAMACVLVGVWTHWAPVVTGFALAIAAVVLGRVARRRGDRAGSLGSIIGGLTLLACAAAAVYSAFVAWVFASAS